MTCTHMKDEMEAGKASLAMENTYVPYRLLQRCEQVMGINK